MVHMIKNIASYSDFILMFLVKLTRLINDKFQNRYINKFLVKNQIKPDNFEKSLHGKLIECTYIIENRMNLLTYVDM